MKSRSINPAISDQEWEKGLRFVEKTAEKDFPDYVEDAHKAGMDALIRCSRTFKGLQGAKFSTYYHKAVIGEMKDVAKRLRNKFKRRAAKIASTRDEVESPQWGQGGDWMFEKMIENYVASLEPARGRKKARFTDSEQEIEDAARTILRALGVPRKAASKGHFHELARTLGAYAYTASTEKSQKPVYDAVGRLKYYQCDPILKLESNIQNPTVRDYFVRMEKKVLNASFEYDFQRTAQRSGKKKKPTGFLELAIEAALGFPLHEYFGLMAADDLEKCKRLKMPNGVEIQARVIRVAERLGKQAMLPRPAGLLRTIQKYRAEILKERKRQLAAYEPINPDDYWPHGDPE